MDLLHSLMKTFTPKTYNILSPAGFDLEIAHMQTLLSKLVFLDSIFGRAFIQERLLTAEEAQSAKNPALGLRGRDLYKRRYPQGRKYDQDIDLTFSDQYPSMAYFYVSDPVDTFKKDWTYQEGQIMVGQPFSLMFWCDLTKLDLPTGEMLKIAILKQLDYMNNLKVVQMYESREGVLADFTITGNLAEYTKYPYYALRIACISTYPIFPENGNGVFDPNTIIDNSRAAVTQPGGTNVN